MNLNVQKLTMTYFISKKIQSSNIKQVVKTEIHFR